MKKILILTVTAGGGHNACAYAMKKTLESKGDVQVLVADIVNEFSTPINKFFTDKGYSIAVASFPKAYKMFYDKYRAADPTDRYKSTSQATAVSILKGVLKTIEEFKPDVIFCTHFYGAIAVTDLKLICDLPVISVASVLDYVNSPFWEATVGIDYLTIPNSDFIERYERLGFDRCQLLPFGIPCQPLPEKLDKTEIRRQLCLNERSFTALVMFGGGYWKGGYKIVKDLVRATEGKDVQLIVVNGKDEDGYKKIEKLKKRLPKLNIVNVGFTKEIYLYLTAADVAVTKCGGVSSSEMLAAGLPMIVTEKIPAQELYNLNYLSGKGFARSFKNRAELKAIFDELISDEKVLIEMRASASRLRRLQENEFGSGGLDSLAEFILGMPEADYTDFAAPDLNKVQRLAKKALREAYRREKSGESNGENYGSAE